MEKKRMFEEQEIHFGTVKIIIGHGKILCISLVDTEKNIELSSSEYKLLWFLLKNARQHLTKDQIAQFLYGHQSYDYEDSIPVTISRLRKKLGTVNPLLPDAIKSVRGTGSYYLDIPAPTVEYGIQQNSGENQQNYRMVKLQELLKLGYSTLDIAKRLVENDMKLYGGVINSYEEGSPEMWESFLKGNPNSFQYLIDKDNTIQGNFSMVSIGKDLEHKLKYEGLKEGELDIKQTRSTHVPAKNHIFLLLNLSVNDEHRTTKTKMMVFEAFLKELHSLARDGVYGTHILNCVHLEHQVPFLAEFGFEKVTDTKHYYQLSLQPFSKKLKESEALKELINKLYDEYKWI